MFSTWLKKIVLFPLFMLMGVDGGDGDTILGGGGEPGDGDTGAGSAAETADSLFTPEEIAAKKESVADAQAEDARRAALTDEERAAEDKAAADKKASEDKEKAGAPESYEEFTLPEDMEGIQLNKEAVEALKPICKELGLSQAKAQNLFGKLLTEVHPKMVAQQNAAWEQVKTGWAEAVKTDAELGGEKYAEKVAVAQRAVNTFGTPELKAALDQYGLGNHPEVVRLMYRVGDAMREDTIVLPGSKPGDKRSIEDRLYGGGK